MRRVSWCLMLVLVSAGCRGDDATGHAELVASPAARRLVGVWTASFTADSHSVTLGMRDTRGVVRGTMVFLPNDHGALSAGGLDGVTHEGAYDLDFAPFGWTTRGVDDPAVVAARVVPARTSGGSDSVYIVLSPGTHLFPVRMSGTFSRDSIVGSWSAYAFSAGGGQGGFVLTRRAQGT